MITSFEAIRLTFPKIVLNERSKERLVINAFFSAFAFFLFLSRFYF